MMLLDGMQGALRPREVLVSDGPLCTAVTAAAAAEVSAADTTAGQEAAAGTGSAGGTETPGGAPTVVARAAAGKQEAAAAGAELLYCDGCTLAVSGAAQPLLLSGSMCNPPLRPLGGISLLQASGIGVSAFGA